jgi:hypothetical protein
LKKVKSCYDAVKTIDSALNVRAGCENQQLKEGEVSMWRTLLISFAA